MQLSRPPVKRSLRRPHPLPKPSPVKRNGLPLAPLTSLVRVCDLSDLTDGSGSVTGWAHCPVSGAVAIDPELGRIAFPSGEPAPSSVEVSCMTPLCPTGPGTLATLRNRTPGGRRGPRSVTGAAARVVPAHTVVRIVRR